MKEGRDRGGTRCELLRYRSQDPSWACSHWLHVIQDRFLGKNQRQMWPFIFILGSDRLFVRLILSEQGDGTVSEPCFSVCAGGTQSICKCKSKERRSKRPGPEPVSPHWLRATVGRSTSLYPQQWGVPSRGTRLFAGEAERT